MCVLIFSASVIKTFFIVKRNERDVIKMYIVLHVKYLLILSDFNETLIFSTDVFKNPQILNFMNIRLVKAELFHADGETDMRRLMVVFRNFAKAPKNKLYLVSLEALPLHHT
jgi:hypothetical protein